MNARCRCRCHRSGSLLSLSPCWDNNTTLTPSRQKVDRVHPPHAQKDGKVLRARVPPLSRPSRRSNGTLGWQHYAFDGEGRARWRVCAPECIPHSDAVPISRHAAPHALNSLNPLTLRTIHLALLQLPVIFPQLLQRSSALVREVRAASRARSAGEEARIPLGTGGLALGSLLALAFLELLLERRRERILLGEDGVGDLAPETPRFVGQLLLFRRADFGHGRQGRYVDEEVLVLFTCQMLLCLRLAQASTYAVLAKRLTADRVIDLVVPGALDASENVLIRNLFYLGLGVVFRVVCENDTFDLVLSLAQPTLLQVV